MWRRSTWGSNGSREGSKRGKAGKGHVPRPCSTGRCATVSTRWASWEGARAGSAAAQGGSLPRSLAPDRAAGLASRAATSTRQAPSSPPPALHGFDTSRNHGHLLPVGQVLGGCGLVDGRERAVQEGAAGAQVGPAHGSWATVAAGSDGFGSGTVAAAQHLVAAKRTWLMCRGHTPRHPCAQCKPAPRQAALATRLGSSGGSPSHAPRRHDGSVQAGGADEGVVVVEGAVGGAHHAVLGACGAWGSVKERGRSSEQQRSEALLAAVAAAAAAEACMQLQHPGAPGCASPPPPQHISLLPPALPAPGSCSSASRHVAPARVALAAQAPGLR